MLGGCQVVYPSGVCVVPIAGVIDVPREQGKVNPDYVESAAPDISEL